MAQKTCYVIAGPNGAGKSTFAASYLVKKVACYHFINADLIAAGISPLRPGDAQIAAGRILLSTMERFVSEGKTFGFESTLSGKTYLNRLQKMKEKGYKIVIFYLQVSEPELAISRVKGRIIEGGHDVQEKDIRRRFQRSWDNFRSYYRDFSDHWILFNNDGEKTIEVMRKDE